MKLIEAGQRTELMILVAKKMAEKLGVLIYLEKKAAEKFSAVITKIISTLFWGHKALFKFALKICL